jgi:hypothetical protein
MWREGEGKREHNAGQAKMPQETWGEGQRNVCTLRGACVGEFAQDIDIIGMKFATKNSNAVPGGGVQATAMHRDHCV